MQKALTEMNVELHHVVTDITGATGLRIIRAILGGERNPAVLARMRDRRCHATVETIERALGASTAPSTCSPSNRHSPSTTRTSRSHLPATSGSRPC